VAQKSRQLRALYAEYQEKKGEAAVSARAGKVQVALRLVYVRPRRREQKSS
jgi:hypothetical protein